MKPRVSEFASVEARISTIEAEGGRGRWWGASHSETKGTSRRACDKAGAPIFCSQAQPVVAFRSKNKLLYYILVYATINTESGFN